jgi:single-stranded-DNA-specific exonuclease
MQKLWQFFPSDPLLAGQLGEVLNVSPPIAQILINRGITDVASARIFLQPRLTHLRDPFEIPNIKTAAERVLLAKERGEKVLVFGDYDVDGVTGTAILIQTLKFLGFSPTYYIPHRYDEGYSLSAAAIKKIAADGVNLIITVDCGISCVAEIALAKELGMEVVVTDHHNIPSQLPVAAAIVNPKMLADDHPSRNLAGAGVAFKFAWALLRQAGIKESAFIASLLDLAALGTIADVVPLAGENRIIAVRGLTLLNQRQRLGLKHLAEIANLPETITVEHIYFGLAPRINAAGRLEHARQALELMLTDDATTASALAKELNTINVRRQDIGGEIKENVFGRLTADMVDKEKVVVLSGTDWHPGVIGIIASQIVDRYFRPAVLIGMGEKVGRGSARSLAGINIYKLLEPCADLFNTFGGHGGAAGFEIANDKIAEFITRLKQQAQATLSAEDLIPKLLIDLELPPHLLTLSLAQELTVFSPHGEGNRQPLFLSRQLKLVNQRVVGRDGRHLKLKLAAGPMVFDGIGFDLGNLSPQLIDNELYDVVYNLEVNEWNGTTAAQLNLVDVRPSSKLK